MRFSSMQLNDNDNEVSVANWLSELYRKVRVNLYVISRAKNI